LSERNPTAVRVFCDNPQQLLNEIKAAIRAGTVQTWLMDGDGDFTHSPEQWKNKAWFRPIGQDDRLTLRIIGRKTGKMSKEIYGVYHGRFVEMLLAHFDLKFTRATATALPADGDWVGS
jgi:hypothetical protein